MDRLLIINVYTFLLLIFLTGVEKDFGYIVCIESSTCSIGNLHGFKNFYNLLHAFPYTCTIFTRAFLNLDFSVFEFVQLERTHDRLLISDLVLKILFVKHHDDRHFVESGVPRQLVELYHRFVELAVLTRRVNHEYYAIDVVEIMLPQFRRLATDVPDCHHIISELDLFYVEADGGNGIGKLPVFTMK